MKSLTRTFLATFAIVFAVGLFALEVSGCGKSAPAIPAAPVITAAATQDVRAGAIKALGILQAAGVVSNHASIIEVELAANGTIPPGVHRAVQVEFGRLADVSKAAIIDIDSHSTQTWDQLKAKIDPILASVQQIVTLSKDIGNQPAGQRFTGALSDLQAILATAAAVIPH